MSQKYVIAHFFDAQASSANFSALEWPLHVTLLPIFTLRRPLEKLVYQLDRLTLSIAPFDIKTEGQALFGADKDVRVSLVRPDKEIVDLHNKLVTMSRSVLAIYDTPQFIGKGYRPHMTIQDEEELHDGQIYRIENVSLVDMYPNNNINRRAIIDTYILRSD